jgi:chromosome segregation ATPase
MNNETITKLQIDVDKATRNGDDQVHETENRCHECQQQIQAEHAREHARLVDELEVKSAKIEEYSNMIQKLEVEISQSRRIAKRLTSENEAKGEEIQKIGAQLDEANSEWNARIEKEKEAVQMQYEALLTSLKEKNHELRTLCSKTNESMSGTERHNRDLIRRIGGLERQIGEMTKQLIIAKEELTREKQLLETKVKTVGIRTELKCQAEIQDLKANFEEELRSLYAVVGKYFTQFLDMKQSFDSRSFKEVIEKVSTEIIKLQNTDAGLRRLLCLSAEESTEDAVSKLLLSLYRQ